MLKLAIQLLDCRVDPIVYNSGLNLSPLPINSDFITLTWSLELLPNADGNSKVELAVATSNPFIEITVVEIVNPKALLLKL